MSLLWSKPNLAPPDSYWRTEDTGAALVSSITVQSHAWLEMAELLVWDKGGVDDVLPLPGGGEVAGLVQQPQVLTMLYYNMTMLCIL